LRVYGEDPPVLERGGELGVFHLGSTVVLLIAPGEPIGFVVQAGARVRMGEALARKGRR
jgi:phosphatidylserine decarboxylase